MKKSLKFLIIFATVAVILSCSVFTSAVSNSDKIVFTPEEFMSYVKKQIVFTGADGDEILYSTTFSDTGMYRYIEENPGITAPFYYTVYTVDVPVNLAPGEYCTIECPFLAGVSSPRTITSGTFNNSVDISPVASWVEGDMNMYTFRPVYAFQNTNSSTITSLTFYFRLHVSGLIQYGTYSFGFFEDISISISSEKPKYSAPSDEAIKEQDELTSQIEDATADGIDEAKGVFNSFDSITGSDSHIYKGLLAATTIMNEWLGIEWLSPIILFSLILGAFAFVLGMSFIFSRFSRNSSEMYHNYKVDREQKTNYLGW